MQAAQSNVFTRDDTFFGICQALGEDFGFSPNWLRLAMGVGLLFAPLATLGAYVAAGVLVGFSRLIAPDRRRAEPAPIMAAPAEAPAASRADNETLGEALAAAA
jgi:phage shock protein C